MKMNFAKLCLFALPFCLTACGEGYEMQRTTNFFPYGNQRTAGSGIMYVRAKMAPERQVNITPQTMPVERSREVPPAPPKAEPSPAEKIFDQHQEK